MNNASFPIAGCISECRKRLFNASHNITSYDKPRTQTPFIYRASCWVGHKAVSVICLPLNATLTNLGLAAIATTSCTLGAFKVALFAASLGNIQPNFSIGFLWLAERSFTAALDIVTNATELASDAIDIGYESYKGAKWVLTALHIDVLVEALVKKLNSALTFISKRLEAGIRIAADDELNQPSYSPDILYPLSQAVRARSCFSGNQSMRRWIEHKALSIVHIPAQTALAATSGFLTLCLTTAFCAKAALYALTTIHIATPTALFQIGTISLYSAEKLVENIGDNTVDVAVLVYNVADTIGVVKAIATLQDLLLYIPKAILS